MRKSIITALILAVIGIGWIASGQFGTEERMQTASGDSASSPTAPASKALMRVRVADLEAVMRVERVDVTGRTEASRTVQIRAETHGQVRELLRQRGDNVEKGAPIARLRLDDRTAKLEEAKASLRQREIEFKAAESLQQKGFRSETDEAAALARLDGARAIVEQMQIDIARTTFRAPLSPPLRCSSQMESGETGNLRCPLVFPISKIFRWKFLMLQLLFFQIRLIGHSNCPGGRGGRGHRSPDSPPRTSYFDCNILNFRFGRVLLFR